MSETTLRDDLLTRARGLGFEGVGVAGADPIDHLGLYRSWLGKGYHGLMGYLERPDAVARRGDLALTLASVRSVLVVAQHYDQPDPEGVPDDPSRGVIARYARGRDYHGVLGGKLAELLDWVVDTCPEPVSGRAYVDTGPVLERALGARAGLGWFGKNTLLIHPRRGSYFFLGVVLLDIAIEPDEPFATDHCGSCRRCLEACPTGALLGYDDTGAPVMDARRCISYLTIELRGAIPRHLRPLLGNRVFGCDICQEVCPWNERFSVPSAEPGYRARGELDGPSLLPFARRLLGMSEKQYQRDYADSPLERPRRKGMLRNLCVALGNWGSEEAVPVLVRALEDTAPLVRAHAAWALGRVGSSESLVAVARHLEREEHPEVVAELQSALDSRSDLD